MLLIYTHKITKRLQYTCQLVFKNLLAVDYIISTDENEFLNYSNAKINYSKQPIGDEIFIASSDLLFSTGIKEQYVKVSEYMGEKTLFPIQIKASLPFDPLAATFYLVSRYEEYLQSVKDKYDRFDAQTSIAYKHGFLGKPIVNIWATMIQKLITEHYPNFYFPKKRYSFIPTIDIDNAYAYRQKGIIRTIGGLLNALQTLDFTEYSNRINVLFKNKIDPYDSYDFMFRLFQQYDLYPVFFILFADYGMYDKNLPLRNKHFQLLIKSISDYAELGIHPSFASNDNPEKLKKEIEQLSRVVNKEIRNSRQHYLKLNIPTTYRNLINMDIMHDYTMGYASQPGFRAGVCSSFLFYDIYLEEETKLTIHPFAVMDGTLKNYMKLSHFQAMDILKPLIDEVKAVNGTFISLWHNESLGTSKMWKGWPQVYEEMIKYAVD